jgi:hypothetical protein
MDRFFPGKRLYIVALFVAVTASLTAQEIDIYKQLLKESIQMDFKKEWMEMPSKPDSITEYIELDVNKNPLPPMGFNYKQNSLFLHYKDSLPIDTPMTISPSVTAAYTNPIYDETAAPPIYNYQNMIPDVTYRHLSGAGFLNLSGLIQLVISLISDENESTPHLSKHEKALKHITEDIYPIDK